MRKIKLEDLQRLGSLLIDGRWRAMTKQEIAVFKIVPDGATKYQDFESFSGACENLAEKNVAYRAGSNPVKGLYWTNP